MYKFSSRPIPSPSSYVLVPLDGSEAILELRKQNVSYTCAFAGAVGSKDNLCSLAWCITMLMLFDVFED